MCTFYISTKNVLYAGEVGDAYRDITKHEGLTLRKMGAHATGTEAASCHGQLTVLAMKNASCCC